jgi:hypothetical protein
MILCIAKEKEDSKERGHMNEMKRGFFFFSVVVKGKNEVTLFRSRASSSSFQECTHTYTVSIYPSTKK